jgi:transcriptional regulator with XRE-family HTH domain
MKAEKRQQCLELRKEGLSMGAIATKLGVAKSTISRWLNAEGREYREPKARAITAELREKYRQGAIKGNKQRKHKRKPYDEVSLQRKKEILIEERGRLCEKCGWCAVNPFSGIVPVQVHHKDGDRDNNTRENLEILCPNCHSMTEKYMFHGQSHKGTWGQKGTKRYR